MMGKELHQRSTKKVKMNSCMYSNLAKCSIELVNTVHVVDIHVHGNAKLVHLAVLVWSHIKYSYKPDHFVKI